MEIMGVSLQVEKESKTIVIFRKCEYDVEFKARLPRGRGVEQQLSDRINQSFPFLSIPYTLCLHVVIQIAIKLSIVHFQLPN